MAYQPYDDDGSQPDEDASSEARAFARGSGFLLQTVGALFFFSSCCVCSSAFLWDPNWAIAMDEAQQTVDQPAAQQRWLEDPAKFGLMLTVMFTTVGGLALLVFGFGLQTEKRRSAWAAVATNLLLLIVLIVAGVGLWCGEASLPARIWHAVLTVIVLALLGFTIPALRQIIANPPPDELHVVPANYDPKNDLKSRQ